MLMGESSSIMIDCCTHEPIQFTIVFGYTVGVSSRVRVELSNLQTTWAYLTESVLSSPIFKGRGRDGDSDADCGVQAVQLFKVETVV